MTKDESDTSAEGPTQDPAEELASLVGSVRSHLDWLAGRGQVYLPAGPSPRYSEPAQGAPDVAALEVGSAEDSAALAEAGVGAAGLARIREHLGDCQRCELFAGRVQLVFGQGNPEAELMFVGEAPGRDEDLQGEAFVGAAGQLLTKMIKAMGFDRDQVFIGNVIKCRPPRNRNPEPAEIARCEPFLMAQIRAIQPAIIVTLGRFAAQTLLQTEQSIGRLRGRLHRVTLGDRELPLVPTYHPAYLLRNPEAKRPVWEDLQLVMAWMKEQGLLG